MINGNIVSVTSYVHKGVKMVRIEVLTSEYRTVFLNMKDRNQE